MLLRAGHKAGCKVDVKIDYCVSPTTRPADLVCNPSELAILLTNVRNLQVTSPALGSSLNDQDLPWHAFLLAHASELESIAIDIPHHDDQGGAEPVLHSHWISQPMSTSYLQEVTLRCMRGVSGQAIIDFLANHKSTLRKLTINNAGLKEDTDRIHVCEWINNNLNLDHVHIDTTLYMHGKVCRRRIHGLVCQIYQVVQTAMPLDGSALFGLSVLQESVLRESPAFWKPPKRSIKRSW